MEQKPEEKARELIDKMLRSAGWLIQNKNELDLDAGPGVAIREVALKNGQADYLLCVDGKAIGVVEAKKAGVKLTKVEGQSQKYLTGVPEFIPHVLEPLPFCYESTGFETSFTDLRDLEPRSRLLFHFHKPETLRNLIAEDKPLRARLRELPTLDTRGLWTCQIEAITNLDRSLKDARPRALIQMATGSGKTFTAVNFIYRLIQFSKAKRVLFLVDRTNLAIQAEKEFANFSVPNDGRKFNEIYNVQRMSSNKIDPVCRVCVTTIQRLYSMLRGREIDPAEEEESLFERKIDETPVEVPYNADIPIEEFDFIVVDECHRSIYSKWRPVLEYFDAFLIGLTATPCKQTFGFFNQNLVMEFSHERAVREQINVNFDVYRIKTEISAKGSKLSAGQYVYKRDRLTRQKRWEQLDEVVEYAPSELDRSVVAVDQIRTVVKAFHNSLPDIFPGRSDVPKTLVFAKDDSHAEDIVRIIREEFGKGNDFCKKITYRSEENPQDLIAEMRNSYNPRIAVTVDLVSTGIDIKPLECLLFMRDVKSRLLFEQMKGRGTRTIKPEELKQVTPDALFKDRFVIIDAVGVCETDKTDSKPLEKKPGVSFEKLMEQISWGNFNEDLLSSLASRLTRLDTRLDEDDKKEIEQVAGSSIKKLAGALLDAIDIDKQEEQAKAKFKIEKPNKEQIDAISKEMAKEAWSLFKPKVRQALVDVKKRSEQIIDEISKDTIILSGFDSQAEGRAKEIVNDFRRFIDDNKDELTALQIIYNKPYSKRHVTYEQIEKLAASLKKPPYQLTPQVVWQAYEVLEKSKVRGAGPVKKLTDIIALVRFSMGQIDFLEPFGVTVNKRFSGWLEGQKAQGQTFTQEQLEWLNLIKDHIATSYAIESDDFDYDQLYQKGGIIRFTKIFGPTSDKLLEELNEVLVK